MNMLVSEQKAAEGVAEPLCDGLTVVVPVFNSEASLAELASRLEPVLLRVAREYELILVNDCSRDNSWDVVTRLAEQHSWIRGINLMRNYGQHNALLCGIRQARHPFIVTMDDDLQHPPEEIPRLLEPLQGRYDAVYGAWKKQKHHPWRALASRLTRLVLQNAMGAETASQVTAFRAFRTELRRAFDAYQSPLVSIDALLTWGTNRFTAVMVRHDARPYGESNYTFGRLLEHGINMVTAFSTLPLRLASTVGFSTTVIGMLLLLFIVGRWLLVGSVVPGFAFTASVVVILGGAQLYCLGIIGEYLARMHFRLMDRPAYAVRETTDAP